jgi:hypothetical protein
LFNTVLVLVLLKQGKKTEQQNNGAQAEQEYTENQQD